ncbi:hypothetical protein DFH06DRAFT_1307987 [Mycena polygramma]|nr:hypothetical protein DFH06DRAFT_1307987 [Mycena polygramma]
MRLLYHQQASSVLAQDNDSSLSKERVELLLAYVEFKYVSVTTKLKILQHLALRAQSLVDAKAIIDGHGITRELLASQDSRILHENCAMLANICSHSALIPSVVALKLVPYWVRLVRSSHDPIRYHTMVSLRRLFYWSHAAAKEAVDAGVLNDMVSLLDATNPCAVAWGHGPAVSWVPWTIEGFSLGNPVILSQFGDFLDILPTPPPTIIRASDHGGTPDLAIFGASAPANQSLSFRSFLFTLIIWPTPR